MKIHYVLVVLLQFVLEHIDADIPFPRREWESTKRFVLADTSYHKNAIFPSIRQCAKTEDILLVQLDIAGVTNNPYAGPDMLAWSAFLNNFIYSNIDDRMEGSQDFRRVIENIQTDPNNFAVENFGLWITLCLMLLFTISGFVIIPIIGFFVFHIMYLIWAAFTSHPLRRLGRNITIRTELHRRKRRRHLLPIIVNKTIQKRFYRVPHCFREYTDESEPEVLRRFQGTIAVQTKDSDSDVSLDKLYHEYYRFGEPIVETDPDTGIPLPPPGSHAARRLTIMRGDDSTNDAVDAAKREAVFEQEMLEKIKLDHHLALIAREAETRAYDADEDDAPGEV